MRCFAVDLFELTNEMEFGEEGFIGNIAEINILSVIAVDKDLGLHNASV